MEQDGSVRFDKPLLLESSQPGPPSKKQTANSENLLSNPANNNYISRKFYLRPIFDFVYRNLFIRNTKESIKDYDVPQVKN